MLLLPHSLLLCSTFSFLWSAAAAQEVRGRFDVFQTEPLFHPSHIEVTYKTANRSKFAPGYHFIGSARSPQIFDNDGRLVWLGHGITNGRTKNFEPCDYLGQEGNHLCWSEPYNDQHGYELSNNRIFDDTYTPMGRGYGAIGGLRSPNPHEFNVLPGGYTFLQAVYQLKPKDLRPYQGIKEGWVLDGCFQEISVSTGLPVFRWCGLDHMDIDNTLLYLGSQNQNYSEGIGGTGVIQDAWDWMHFNAVDKNEEGDYLISARHLSQIIKVAGNDNRHGVKPGTVLWQLGGKRNDFEMEDDFSFSRQHMVRFLKTTGDETTLSLFNNGWVLRNKYGFADHASSGQVIVINNSTMKARLIHEYVHPAADAGFKASLTIAAGSMEVQPNGGCVVGWGTLPEVSEYAEDGELLFHAYYNNHSGYNYRSYKREWVGNPQYPPKLVAYSRTCVSDADESPLIAYVSWNGATEVVAWRFFISTTTRVGPWISAGTFERDGFETAADLTHALKATLAHFAPYVSVEALDERGRTLGSTIVQTFVPAPKYKDRCDAYSCFQPAYFEYDKEVSCGPSCGRTLGPAVLVFFFVVMTIETGVYFANIYWRATWRLKARMMDEETMPLRISDEETERSRRTSEKKALQTPIGGPKPFRIPVEETKRMRLEGEPPSRKSMDETNPLRELSEERKEEG